MNSTNAGTLLPLFGGRDAEEETPAGQPEPARVPLGMRPAAARLICTTSPDLSDPQRRPLAFLVVECPFCDHQHVHPAGHPDAPRVCPRHSRCVGRPTGAYYFPEVSR